MRIVKKIISRMHQSGFCGRLFHTLNFCLQQELAGCQTVLDLGCGLDSPLRYCKAIKYSLGVDRFTPYLDSSKKKGIHNDYMNEDILKLDFGNNSFDAVIMIDVLEHLPKRSGSEILDKARKWAIKKVIVTTPNGFVRQESVDANVLQQHLSGWDYQEMFGLGYKCKGLAGLKFLRDNNYPKADISDDLTVSIRFRPRILFFTIATLSQTYTYYFPRFAYSLFCVKESQKA